VELVFGQKMKMIAAVVVGTLLGFLLLGLSNIFVPEQTSQPPPPLPTSKAEPLTSQILWTAQWIGLAALIAITVVSLVLFVGLARNKLQRRKEVAENNAATPQKLLYSGM
jgi:uncharacterized membrane-anchored protein YhcB (DUF1043 family)